jgi:hypothetical protein
MQRVHRRDEMLWIAAPGGGIERVGTRGGTGKKEPHANTDRKAIRERDRRA